MSTYNCARAVLVKLKVQEVMIEFLRRLISVAMEILPMQRRADLGNFSS
jgi:hypothetical protein